MTEDELTTYFKTNTNPESQTIGAPDGNRTLLYGYDCDRRTWHVYSKEGKLFRLIYERGWVPQKGYKLVSDVSGKTLPISDLIPNKRLYPEACDFLFCDILYRRNVNLPFTSYDGESAKRITERMATTGYIGLTIDEFVDGYCLDDAAALV